MFSLRRSSLTALLLFLGAASGSAQAPPYPGPALSRHELAKGVWAFLFDNAVGGEANVDGTSVVIINQHDVVVVDAQWTPHSTRRVLAEIRKLTRNPVRYVITTHWHGDHWFGNQVYQEAFPGVEFVAHPNTLRDLDSLEIPDIEPTGKTTIPNMIRDFEERLAKGVRRDGQPYTATDSANVRHQIAALRWAGPAFREIRPVRPTLLVADSLVLRRGERTIVIRYMGRGNTRGDLSVWLPKEQVLATGDLLVNPVPYSFGSYLSEWMVTLGRLRALPARVIVPGHGALQRDWSYLDQVVELLGATVAQASEAVGRGLDLDSTRKVVDLSALRERFVQGDERRARAFDAWFLTPAVERAWLEARGELDKTGE